MVFGRVPEIVGFTTCGRDPLSSVSLACEACVKKLLTEGADLSVQSGGKITFP